MPDIPCVYSLRVHVHHVCVCVADPGPGVGGLLILDRGYVEVYGPNRKKGISIGNVF